MSRHAVTVNSGFHEVVLPDGKAYDGPVTVNLTDEEFEQIDASAFAGGTPVLSDGGEVT